MKEQEKDVLDILKNIEEVDVPLHIRRSIQARIDAMDTPVSRVRLAMGSLAFACLLGLNIYTIFSHRGGEPTPTYSQEIGLDVSTLY